MKTNKQWYPYEELGSYYQLREGVLWYCPMMQNGEKASEEGEGEFEFIDEDKIELVRRIKAELQHKE